MNLLGRTNKRVLVHKEMRDINTIDSVDIVLTPQFYTFLKEELGVKFSYQAKQIAPSLFDDYLDKGEEYQFHVYKCDDDWCFFAYSVDEIISFLESKGLKAHQINKIFFAQELAPYIENAIELSPNSAMHSIDDIVTILPQRLISSDYRYSHLDIDSLSLKNGIALGSSYNSLVPLKETIIITSLLILLGIVFFIEGGRYSDSMENLVSKKDKLLEKNSKLSSNRVRKSILQKYVPIDRDERAKRDSIKEISKLLFSESRLKELTIEDKKISAKIKVKNSNVIKQIENQNKNFKIKREKNSIVRLERTL